MIQNYLRLAALAIMAIAFAFPSTGLACSMTSNPEVTIALGDPAPHTISEDEILEGTPTCTGFTVTVFNTNGSMRLTPVVDCNDVGDRLLVKVTSDSGNSVWSYVTIVDNLRPVVTASNITITCVEDIEQLGFDAISVSDNCTAPEDLEYRITSTPSSVGCANGIAQTFVRSIFVIDESGNRSATIPQTITVERIDITDVDFPENITYLTSDTTICPAEFGTPEIEFPTVNGNPISSICKLLTTVEDEPLASCGSSRKILRNYRVLDCCTNQVRTGIQVITIMDDQAPIILNGIGLVLQDTINAVNIQGNQNCTGTAFFQAISAQDSCGSDPLTYRISTPFGMLNSNGGFLNASFPLDGTSFNAIYEVSDACGNTARDTVVVLRNDNQPPVAICDENTTVSLATASTTVPAINFDDGSYDNCFIDSFTVRRMGDIDWEEFVTFTCDDVGDTVLVEFRVTDFDGNSNICMVSVIVEDKIPATVNPLPTLTFRCFRNPVDTFLSGVPTVNEVCVGGYQLDTIINDDSMLQCRTGVQKRKFIFTNAAGQMIMTTQMINYVDSGSFTIPTMLADTTIDCSADPLRMPARQFSTDCDVFAVNTSATEPEEVLNCSTSVFRVTYNYMPLCGNRPGFSVDRNITQIDTQGPVWDSFPGDIDSTYACELPTTVLAPTATDDCSGAIVELVDVSTVPAGTTNCPDVTNIYTWMTRDSCGNENPVPFVRVIRLRDTIAPTFGTIDSFKLACKAEIRDTLPAFIAVANLVTDNCGGMVTLAIQSSVYDTADACVGSILRTYLATDLCGNSSTASQVISYEQTNRPLILNTLPTIRNLQCYDDVVNAPLPSTLALGGSACGDGLTIVGTSTEPNPMICPATILRTYTVEDDCGNSGMISQAFEYNDDTDPEIFGVVDLSYQCQSDVPSSALTMGAISVTENCGVDTLIASDVLTPMSGACSGSIIRTYTAIDDCGNTGTAEQTITWDGVGALSLNSPAANTTEFNCYQDVLIETQISDPSFFGTGFCGTDLRIDSVNHSVDPGCSGQVLRGYYLQDGCGNRDSVFQTFMVNDTIAPVFTSIEDIMVACASDVPAPSATIGNVIATDNCVGRMATVQFFSDNVISSGMCSGSLIRTYFASDGCGNASTATQLISYDQTGQTLTFESIDTIRNLQCYDEVINTPNPTVVLTSGNICDDALTVTLLSVEAPPGTCPATVSKTFSVSDECGNSGIVTQAFIYNDVTDPTISNVADITVQCQSDVPSDSLTLLDIMVEDNCSVDTVVVSNVANPTNTSCSGSIIRSYTATDDCGNTAVADQSISWNGVGALTLNTPAPNPTVYSCYQEILDASQITDPSFFGTGFCGTSLQIDSVNHSDDPGCMGQVLRGYYLQDGCGNRDSVYQIFMLNDTVGPTFTGVPDTMIQCAADLPSEQMTSAVAYDSCSMTVVNFTVTTNPDPNNNTCAGSFTRTFTATDICGNSSVATQIISYGSGTQSLGLDNLPNFSDTLQCFQDVLNIPEISDPTSFGNGVCGTSLMFFAPTGHTDLSMISPCLDSVFRFYFLQDGCGNRDTVSQKFIIRDNEGPVFNLPGRVREFSTPLDGSSCQVRLAYRRNANDLCGNEPLILSNNAPAVRFPNTLWTLGDSLGIGTYIIDFTAEDQCGNLSIVTDTVIVVDPLAPNIDCNPVIFEMEPDGTVSTTISDVIDSLNIFDLCSPLTIDFTSPPQLDFTCQDVGMPSVFTVVATDTFGNETICATQIGVDDLPNIDCRTLTYSVTDATPVILSEADLIAALNISNNCPSDIGLTITFNTTFPLVFECPIVGNPVDFPFSVEVIDDFGREVNCDFIIQIRHTCSSPPADPFSLAGRVDAPLYGGAMDETIVDLEYSGGSVQTLSDADGYYSFTNVPPGAISLSAKLPMHPADRVTTYDMLRIGQHILGVNELDNPMLILAADVNKSGSVSAFDLTAIRRVILGQDPAFAGQHEATTFGAYHPFSDQSAPWVDANNWGTSFSYVSTDMMSQDISMVKLGDINPTDFLRPRGASELHLEDAYVTAGETVEILVRNDYQTVIAGLQLALKTEGELTIKKADSNIEVFSNKVDDDTRISIIQEILQGEPIMVWSFIPNSSGMLSELIQISSDIPNESYAAEDLQPAQLALNWKSTLPEDSVPEINAFPNPFDDHLSISTHLTEPGRHVLQVNDMSGRSFAERRIEVNQDSWHNLRLDASNWSPGVYILVIEGPTGRLTKRVVLQR